MIRPASASAARRAGLAAPSRRLGNRDSEQNPIAHRRTNASSCRVLKWRSCCRRFKDPWQSACSNWTGMRTPRRTPRKMTESGDGLNLQSSQQRWERLVLRGNCTKRVLGAGLPLVSASRQVGTLSQTLSNPVALPSRPETLASRSGARAPIAQGVYFPGHQARSSSSVMRALSLVFTRIIILCENNLSTAGYWA